MARRFRWQGGRKVTANVIRVDRRRLRRCITRAAGGDDRWTWKDGENDDSSSSSSGESAPKTAGEPLKDAVLDASPFSSSPNEGNRIAFEPKKRRKSGKKNKNDSKLNEGAGSRRERGSVATQGIETQPWEPVYVQALAAYFTLLILDGIVIAGSSFLPEFVDDFAVSVLYPSYSGLIGLFFALSAGYGAFKYIQGAFD